MKYDKAGALRFDHLHRSLEGLLQHYSFGSKTIYWLYLDP